MKRNLVLAMLLSYANFSWGVFFDGTLEEAQQVLKETSRALRLGAFEKNEDLTQ